MEQVSSLNKTEDKYFNILVSEEEMRIKDILS
jgi:hypothetical protein